MQGSRFHVVKPATAHVFCLTSGEAKQLLEHATFSSPFESGLPVGARVVLSNHVCDTSKDVRSR
jgi:hypothetical protein